MLKRLFIQNFQSWKKQVLDFHPGVNAIIGPTDAGKSAIFRALIWNLYNRPLGDSFRSNWGGDTLVQTEFDDVILQRFKNKNHNYYDLNTDVYKAFGQDPPDEILQAHNLSRSLNIQSQIDPFFLLQSSPGEVAKYLNEIAKLSDIDKANKYLDSHNKKQEQEKTSAENNLDELNKQLKEFENLDQVNHLLKQAQNIQNKINELQTKKQDLAKIKEQVKKTSSNIDDIKHKLKIKPLVEIALNLKQQINSKQEQKENLEQIVSNVQSKQNHLEQLNHRLKIKPLVEIALNLEQQVNNKQEQKEGLKQITSNIQSKQNYLEQLNSKLEKNKSKFKQEMSGTCPLCGQECPNSISISQYNLGNLKDNL